MNFRLRFCVRVVAALMLASSATVAGATTHWVNDDDPNGGGYAAPGTSCNDPGYPTIQAAVTASTSGDRINACPGTYTEQVTIPAGKNSILLRSVSLWAAMIQAPAMMADPKAIVRVNGAQGVTILAFTITGPGGALCDSLRYGVRVDDGGSADILGNHITHIHDTPFSGCQNGVAVLVGRQLEGTTGTARILGNVIDNYQKNGPTVSNSGSSAEIAFNRILGIGSTDIIAQNGIQASGGATATIRHNFVAENVFSPQTFAATGILLFQSGKVVIDHNTATTNDVSVYMFNAAAGSTTAFNRMRASTFDGLALDTVTGGQATDNKSEQNNGPGIGVYDSQSNAIGNNFAERNSDNGILLNNADSNDIGNNKVRDNGSGTLDMTDGIRADALSIGNTIHDNHLKNNVQHDCHDFSVGTGTAMTGNFWLNNHGQTSQPPGLCGGTVNDADFATATVFGWDPTYAWYLAFNEAVDFDWAAGYATIDTATLLLLPPEIRIGESRHAPTPVQ